MLPLELKIFLDLLAVALTAPRFDVDVLYVSVVVLSSYPSLYLVDLSSTLLTASEALLSLSSCVLLGG